MGYYFVYIFLNLCASCTFSASHYILLPTSTWASTHGYTHCTKKHDDRNQKDVKQERIRRIKGEKIIYNYQIRKKKPLLQVQNSQQQYNFQHQTDQIRGFHRRTLKYKLLLNAFIASHACITSQHSTLQYYHSRSFQLDTHMHTW